MTKPNQKSNPPPKKTPWSSSCGKKKQKKIDWSLYIKVDDEPENCSFCGNSDCKGVSDCRPF